MARPFSPLAHEGYRQAYGPAPAVPAFAPNTFSMPNPFTAQNPTRGMRGGVGSGQPFQAPRPIAFSGVPGGSGVANVPFT